MSTPSRSRAGAVAVDWLVIVLCLVLAAGVIAIKMRPEMPMSDPWLTEDSAVSIAREQSYVVRAPLESRVVVLTPDTIGLEVWRTGAREQTRAIQMLSLRSTPAGFAEAARSAWSVLANVASQVRVVDAAVH